MNVLIAEDDALMRLLLQRAVEHQGHACLVAQDGLEAWHLFQAHTVDVVISDWLMPLVDGIELCRRVRKRMDRTSRYTYFIFLAMLDDKEHMRAAMQEGADDYRTKPLNPTDLWTRLRVAARVMSLYRQVAAHKAELERSNAERAQFASVVSHDLQSPLSSIAGFSQLLQEHYADHLDAKTTKYITGIMDGTKRMQALIEGGLAYAQVGAQAPPQELLVCTVVVERALANLHATIEQRGALVTHGDLPTVDAEATQLSQVFQNQIGNAIKYCRETPRVTVSAQREGAEWLFSVRDNSIGMDAADAERIFDLFQRAHSAAEYPGIGIGLAICKKTIERHGGRIWAESCVASVAFVAVLFPCHHRGRGWAERPRGPWPSLHTDSSGFLSAARCDQSDISDKTIMPCPPRVGHGGSATMSQPVSITSAPPGTNTLTVAWHDFRI